MTYVSREQVTQLDYVTEDLDLARRTARLAANGQQLSTEQFQFQQRQLERALEALAAYRDGLAVAERRNDNVISIAAKAAA